MMMIIILDSIDIFI